MKEKLRLYKFISCHKKPPARGSGIKASLTIEAAIVLPVFLYFFIAIIYFIQIITVQEHIQQGITRMGLSLAKSSYLYSDFTGPDEVESYDASDFGYEIEYELKALTEAALEGTFLKQMVKAYLDAEIVNHSAVLDGFNGLSFYESKVLDSSDCIDIVVRYRIRIPVKLFGLEDIRLIQRVKLRAWNGHRVPACYRKETEGEEDETYVYITNTGSVYHKNMNCSHIKLSIEEISYVPTERRNKSGGKYYPCEICCSSDVLYNLVYYITAYGERYHTKKDCPKIKRTVTKVLLSEVEGREPCKRCGR
ncbi:hypothetical protein I5677_08955 [Mobilitalea sibirica]|uniref:TadE-like protein n=1 Tax=Mobilitalea sibirica TaxID=1462919 RepID=A0A8J7L2N3_9FIRM|nr:hypothetical protein [Mobilitalea sibirica]MBH1941018.1 hypothetical protein [Mobilitalea sibirica]